MIDKLKRLGAMSGREIAHRLREQIRREADRMRFRSQRDIDQDHELDQLIRVNGGSLKTYFDGAPARRFFASTEDWTATFRFVMENRPEWLERAIREADAVKEHRVTLLAHEDVRLGSDVNWHRDPLSGHVWPQQYWGDYDFVNGPSADAKVIHELNRHQHLPKLAKAFFLTGEEGYAQEAVAQLESWIAQNPRWLGVNWQSSLEIGIRSLSWLWTIFLLRRSQSLTDDRLQRICRSLFAQLDHVHRYPSVYTSPNTHLIGEAAALYIAGIVFQELPRARAWREFGERTLVAEMQRQVSADGVYRELSSYYHCYAADFYLHAVTLAMHNGRGLPEWTRQRLMKMFDFVMHITHPDGTIPFFGDDDGGRVLGIAAANYSSYSDGLCSAAVLFKRGDMKFRCGRFCEDTMWLLGPAAALVFEAIEAQTPTQLRGVFENAGYFVQRSGWGAEDTQVTFDCNALGISSGGHEHADALSFTVFSGGREILIDPGTSVYNCAPEWRRFFRSTAAHNTALVDGKGQWAAGHTFRWLSRTPARLRRQTAVQDLDYVDGSVTHAGENGAPGVTHRRRLVYVRPNYWIVLDELNGRGEHDVDFLFHFAAGAQLAILSDEKRGEIDCRAQVGDAGLQLCTFVSEPASAEAVCGATNPIQGWASQLYGERHPAPALKISTHGSLPVSMMSFMAPGRDSLRTRRFNANSNHAIAATIRDGNYDDIAVMAVEDGDLHLMEFSMRGEFFLLRTEQTQLRRLFAVNAYSFSWKNQTVFESDEAIPYVHAYVWDNGVVIERGDNEGKVYVRDLRDRQFQRN